MSRTKPLAATLVLLSLMPTTAQAQYGGSKVSLDFRNQTRQEVVLEYEVGLGNFAPQRQHVPLAPGSQLHDHYVKTNSTLTVSQGGRTARFAMDRHFNVIEFTGFDTHVDPWRDGEFQAHINNLTDHPIDFTVGNDRPRRLDADLSTAVNFRNRTSIRLTLENRAEYLVNADRDTDIIVLPRAVFVDGTRIQADREGRKPDRYRDFRVTIDNRSTEQVSYRFETSWGDFTRRTPIQRNRRIDFDVRDHNELEVEVGGEPHLFVVSGDTTVRLIRGYMFVNNRRYKAHHDKRNRLGIEYKLDHDGGVEITSIARGSAAENMGLRTGMILLTVNGEHIHSTDDFEDAVERAADDRGGRLSIEALDADRIFEANGRIS